MQSYRDESKSVPPSTAVNALGATPATRPDEMGKYRARYEESMNPFEVFRGRVGIAQPCLCYRLLNRYTGSTASRTGSQSHRTRNTSAYTTYPGQPTITKCIHCVRFRIASTRSLYLVRVYH